MSYQILSTEPQDILKIEAVKNYLRISHDYDDLWLHDLIDGAICAAENFLRTKLLCSIVQMSFDKIENYAVKLSGSPIAEILEVTANDECNFAYSIKDNVVRFDYISGFKELRVKYIVGYKNQQDIPAYIRQALMLHVAEMYDNHGSVSVMSSEVQKLYQPYRIMSI